MFLSIVSLDDIDAISEKPPNSSRIIIPGNIFGVKVNRYRASALLSLKVKSIVLLTLGCLILPYLSALPHILTDIQAKVNIGSLKI